MNLLQVRQKFRELSGRFDLVNEDGSDNGANFFINEGKKFLDRLYENQKSWATVFRFLDVGQFSITFPFCRAIKEVWVSSTNARWQLTKLKLQDLISRYMAGLPESRIGGVPKYYSPGITRYIPEDAIVTDLESYVGFVDIPSGNSHSYNSILLNIPTDVKLSVAVTGLFYSKELELDSDTNYWSEVHPMLLIMSAMRQVEIINRNTQGVNDWNNAIMTEAKQIDNDLVEELIAEADQMGVIK